MKKVIYLFMISTFISSCDLENFKCYDGKIIKKELKLETFHGIDIELNGEVTLVDGTEQKIIIEGREDFIKDLEKRSQIISDIWKVRVKDHCYTSVTETKFTLTIPGLREIAMDGTFKLISDGVLRNINKNITLNLEGNGETSLTWDTISLLDMEIDSKCVVRLRGATDKLIADCDGTSYLEAHDLKSETADLEVDGNAKMDVYVVKTLITSIDGNGKICYKGTPKIISENEGNARLINCN